MISGKIIKGISGLYTVDTNYGLYKCKLRGIFRKDKKIPIIGDFVKITVLDKEKFIATIDIIEKRKNELKRPRVSNIDQAIIVVSYKNPDINIDLLDRFIIMAEEKDLDIVICINKIDIADIEKCNEIKNIYNKIGYKVIFTSVKRKIGILDFNSFLKGKVSVFAGCSGVGKSSIINMISPRSNMEVGKISEKIKKGKHTTRHSEIIEINKKTYIIDSPGFSSIFFDNINKLDLQYYFKEFRQFIGKCKFNNCTHIEEPECKIKENIIKGNITKQRYDRYKSFFNELK